MGDYIVRFDIVIMAL
jgi:hypothetical protein